MPTIQTSEYVQTSSGFFSINREARTVRYQMAYKVVKPVKERLRVVVEFQNPTDVKHPLFTETVLEPGQTDLRVESPDFSDIQDGHTYSTVLRAYRMNSDAALFSHAQDIAFIRPPGI